MDHQPLDLSNDDTLWHLLSTRDPSAEGKFFYGVKTTRIFCRPTCKARLARRSNILYFATPAEAQAAGFRACKRCRPDLSSATGGGKVFAPEAERVYRVCGLVREAVVNGQGNGKGGVKGKLPGLREMADMAGLTRFHFHRLFKREMGVTPREFVKGLLGEGKEGWSPSTFDSSSISSTTTPGPSDSTLAVASVSSASSIGRIVAPSTLTTRHDELGENGLIEPLWNDSSTGKLDWDDLFAIDDFIVPDLTETTTITAATTPISFLYYTIRDIKAGRLLIALQNGQVCWTDVDTDDMTLLSRLELAFPSSCYARLLIECGKSSAEMAAMNVVADEMVATLENLSKPSVAVAPDSEPEIPLDCWSMGQQWMGVG